MADTSTGEVEATPATLHWRPWSNVRIYVKLKDRKRSLSVKNDHSAFWH